MKNQAEIRNIILREIMDVHKALDRENNEYLAVRLEERICALEVLAEKIYGPDIIEEAYQLMDLENDQIPPC